MSKTYEQILNRWTGAVMCNGLSLEVVLEKHKKWLRSEDGGERADLSDADLSGANLSGANLRAANLSAADLSGADLSGANLRAANLRAANLSAADLSAADLSGADPSAADPSAADLRGVPKIEKIHQTVFAAASKPDALDMGSWHTCDTTHCRAGWVVHLAGEAGKAMEYCLGTPAAAALIYLKSDPKMEKVPNFYASGEDALADMKRLAELETQAA